MALVGSTSACATKQGTGTLIGAGAGAALGAAVSGGSVWGVLAGAAVGGAAGNLIGKNMDEQAKELNQAVPTAEVNRVGEGINMTFDSSVMFTINSAELSSTAKQDLAAAATVFTKPDYSDTNILVEGHTDDTGTDAINQPLSERRADAVAAYLQTQGVAASRLSTEGYGSSQPKYSNDTPEGQSKNRRVELGIYANDDMVADAQAAAG
ncbi:MAG: OmpA family protein [marine benthic group bacterium]|nr:OmpA family protein [Gemmatimonadota bacterium]